MWRGPLHDKSFVQRILKETAGHRKCYNTWPRIYGMLTVAQEVSHCPSAW